MMVFSNLSLHTLSVPIFLPVKNTIQILVQVYNTPLIHNQNNDKTFHKNSQDIFLYVLH